MVASLNIIRRTEVNGISNVSVSLAEPRALLIATVSLLSCQEAFSILVSIPVTSIVVAVGIAGAGVGATSLGVGGVSVGFAVVGMGSVVREGEGESADEDDFVGGASVAGACKGVTAWTGVGDGDGGGVIAVGAISVGLRVGVGIDLGTSLTGIVEIVVSGVGFGDSSGVADGEGDGFTGWKHADTVSNVTMNMTSAISRQRPKLLTNMATSSFELTLIIQQQFSRNPYGLLVCLDSSPALLVVLRDQQRRTWQHCGLPGMLFGASIADGANRTHRLLARDVSCSSAHD